MSSSIFSLWRRSKSFINQNNFNFKSYFLNFGPQHPASHGVLRLLLQMIGESIQRLDSHIGFLHRGTEKLMEQRPFLLGIPYLDRLDYVSMMTQEHSYVLSLEELLHTTSNTANYVQLRTIFDELTRLLNHYLGLATHSLDIGSMSPVFWAFEERERIMEFYERASGARMHAAYYKPNELNWSGINSQFFIDLVHFLRNTFKAITEMYILLSTNKIWKKRLVDIGIISIKEAESYGNSGVVLRSVGLKKDLRCFIEKTYGYYYFVHFLAFLGKRGDSYDRFIIRIREMFESVNIMLQIVIKFLKTFRINSIKKIKHHKLNFFYFYNYIQNPVKKNYNKKTRYAMMESLIEHFKYFSSGFYIIKNLIYSSIEAPKGEFGVSVVTDGSNKPYRCKFRSPAYNHLNSMERITFGHMFADMIAILGSQDIVFGEIDR